MTNTGPRLLESSADSSQPEAAHRLKRWLYVTAGTLLVGIAILGIFLPLLPATPFLLLAAGCFGKSSPRAYRWLVTNRVFPQGLLLMRAAHFARAGGFDEKVRLVEDWDMLLRLSRLGDLRFVNRVILHYRRHLGNMSVENHRANREAARMMHHRIFFAAENDERQQQLLRKTWRAWQSYLAHETWREMRCDLQHGRLHHTPRRVAQFYLQLHRYLRGYPTLDGI